QRQKCEYPIALSPACALYSIHNSCRVTPGFLISVSKYNMSGITSSDAKVSLGGKMSFSSVSWDISAGNGHDREEALKRARTSKTVEADRKSTRLNSS